MIYKEISYTEYVDYMFLCSGMDDHLDEIGPKTIKPNGERIFGELLVFRTRLTSISYVVAYATIPNSFKPEKYSLTDLKYYISKEYIVQMLIEGKTIQQLPNNPLMDGMS